MDRRVCGCLRYRAGKEDGMRRRTARTSPGNGILPIVNIQAPFLALHLARTCGILRWTDYVTPPCYAENERGATGPTNHTTNARTSQQKHHAKITFRPFFPFNNETKLIFQYRHSPLLISHPFKTTLSTLCYSFSHVENANLVSFI